MVKQTIKIFARVKPTKSRVGVSDSNLSKMKCSNQNDACCQRKRKIFNFLQMWILMIFVFFQLYDIDEDDESIPRLTLCVPREMKDGFINNKKENYKFRFDPPPLVGNLFSQKFICFWCCMLLLPYAII